MRENRSGEMARMGENKAITEIGEFTRNSVLICIRLRITNAHISRSDNERACSHGGLVEKGLEIFLSMKEKHRIVASKEHYACIVDLLCRSGRVEDAYELVKNMSIEITESIVGSFFSGCKIHGRRDLAKQLAQDLQGMDLERPGGLVTLSNMYAADGEWEEVGSVRKLMKDKGVNKRPGFSSVTKRDGSVECDLGEILDNVNHGSGRS
ncbi:hypothetical protein Nepgr_031183 [Nepenthes gracilis]|uniref:Pentatricopeptide repeat-containing protein n=1 Tax=Nepenthes gracilis TaxID=150966 RepID=A0AAD3Y6K1_NEPGR|nr:hypothetical protein Nepgr_031183 [Nepenthes gracilis]